MQATAMTGRNSTSIDYDRDAVAIMQARRLNISECTDDIPDSELLDIEEDSVPDQMASGPSTVAASLSMPPPDVITPKVFIISMVCS